LNKLVLDDMYIVDIIRKEKNNKWELIMKYI
jgi:hypothetical protein